MIKKNVLVLSTYPVEEPLHGGQKRLKATLDFYNSIFSEVRFIAVFHKKYFDKYSNQDLIIDDDDLIARMDDEPYISDLISGESIYKDVHIKQKLKKILMDFRPDIIHVEQIYPFAGLGPLLNELAINPKLILGSQNDETRLKKDILTGLKIEPSKINDTVKEIHNLEVKVTKLADLVIAVNENDAQMHIKFGAKKCRVIPNGISKIYPTDAAINHWRKFKKERGFSKFVTFVGSAHPPNMLGFDELIGRNLDFLPEAVSLMLAGGVSNYIQQEYGAGKKLKKFWEKAWPLGFLSDDNLAGLIVESDVIILPIVSGVGSNLKTAEAILSGKKIVATNLAFKTFEDYRALPNIYFANSQREFKDAIVTALRSNRVHRTNKQEKLAEKVQWKYCFAPLKKELEILIYGRAAAYFVRMKNSALRIAKIYQTIP